MRPKEVLEAWYQAFIARDVDGLMRLYADEAVNHQVAETPLQGKAAIRQRFIDFFAAFPLEGTKILNVFEDGDWAIWEWQGVHHEEPYMHGCGFFQIQNGKIIFQRGYWDKMTFLKAHNLPIQTN